MFALGWKDILRPIRDGLRDRFPQPKPDKDLEKRRRQQGADALRGFAYLEDFDQLLKWKAEDVDPIQRANTPLLPRVIRPLEERGGKSRSSVLLCHDSHGNYHPWESTQGLGVDSESYACEHLQFVEAFIYFSHKLVCIPPASWINALHRNGIRVLGTFLVEPGSLDVERILTKEDHPSSPSKDVFVVAKQLAAIAKYYAFDGWLINIEKTFPRKSWNLHGLLRFTERLKEEVGPSGKIIWYDALTVGNQVNYQNSLTRRNLAFAQAAGGLLTNYRWTEADVLNAMTLAAQNQIQLADVYYGIDVWAQNVRHTGRKRITYPAKGGGGTNTGVAVARLSLLGFSAGIFAPAWPFEHCPKHPHAVGRSMWDGDELPADLGCDCGDRWPHHTQEYRQYPITSHAYEHPAGSGDFFYTDFSRAFASHAQQLNPIYDGHRLHSQVAARSVLPHLLRPSSLHDQGERGPSLYSRLRDEPARLEIMLQEALVPFAAATQPSRFERTRLYKLDMAADGTLEAKFRIRRPLEQTQVEIGFLLQYSNGIQVEKPSKASLEPQEMLFRIEGASHASSGVRLQQIDVYVRGCLHGLNSLIPLLEITEMVIAPVERNQRPLLINNIRIEQCGQREQLHRRLLWEFHDVDVADSEEQTPELLRYPCSGTTGPFAYFLVEVNGLCIGRAYAMEFVFRDEIFKYLADETGIDVRVIGMRFDGDRCPSAVAHLLDEASEWQIV